ncbi:hypothetical protein KMS_R34060 [Pseudomonas sp. LRP2-20]|uniref:hypothetical protein n=1 Tax=Pseudomonas sp. LRP2-20 TaxID=2944234 RepID=UPI00218A90E9|nr:hypothetical protein [Pseudomonas sp. LRP2-20]BDM23649.1 hypothetical protein KMS_R34060 [Pseudomonas sp. LRP2-20]
MRRVSTALLLVAIGLTSGCFKNELSPEEKALVDSLRTELKATQSELNDAKAKDATLSGGLMKALVGIRVEILGANVGLLEQRLNALESGSPIKQVTQVSKAEPELAKKLEAEISVANEDLAKSRADAAVTGGLVGVMKAAGVATKEQTLAMLQQRYLVAKYGLSLPLPPVQAVPATAEVAPNAQVNSPLPAAGKQAPELPAGSGPFGLEAGLSKDLIERMTGQLLTVEDEAQSLYMLESPPKPNDAFEQYGLIISPTVGLCQIRAIGKTINTNDYGHQLRDAFNGLQSALTTVYGKPQVLDALMPGSIWKDSRDWMMALRKKDRSLIAEWKSTQSAPLKSDVKNITMVARAQNTDKGYIVAQYSFSNEPTCEAEENQRTTGSL